MNIFPTANDARYGARNNLKIYNEIRAIELAIFTAIDAGQLLIDVSNTPMTDPSVLGSEATLYGAVFSDDAPDSSDTRSRAEQMDLVEANFVNLGYVVTRLLNTGTGNTFMWEIRW